MKTERIKIGDLNVCFDIVPGAKSAVIFLHGWGGNRKSYGELWPELEINQTLIAVDAPGFGESEHPKTPWDMKDYADFLEDFCLEMIEKYKLSYQLSFVVHSFGGRMIFKFVENPRKIQLNKLVLIASAGIKHPDSLKVFIIKTLSKLLKGVFAFRFLRPISDIIKKLLYRVLRTHDYEDLNPMMKKTFQNVINEDLRVNISKINVPTKIFWGKHDSYVPLSDAYSIHKSIVNSSLTVFEDGKHGIHKTHAKQIAKELNLFFNEK